MGLVLNDMKNFQICLMVRNPNQTNDFKSNRIEGEEEDDESMMYSMK